MTPDRLDETPEENAEHGVLDDSGTLDTASISILGGHIAQVSVSLPPSDDEDRDDDVVEDEMPVDDIVIPDASTPALPDGGDAAVLDAPIDEVATGDIILEPHVGNDGHEHGEDEVVDAELVAEEDHQEEPLADEGADASEATGTDPDGADEPAQIVAKPGVDAATDDVFDGSVDGGAEASVDVDDEIGMDVDGAEGEPAGETDDEDQADDGFDAPAEEPAPAAEPLTRAPWIEAGDERASASTDADETVSTPDDDAAPAPAAEASSAPVVPASADLLTASALEPETAASTLEPTAPASTPDPETAAAAERIEPEPTAATAAATTAAAAAATAAAAASPPPPATRAARAATGVIGTVPLTRREVHQADEAARVDRAHAMERVRTPAPEVTLSSKRLGELDDTRESPDLLTADRLLDPRQIGRPEPEGLWQQLVYSLSRHRINLGDGRRARARKELDRRISTPLAGGARFVPVLSRKGGVGKTTVTALLGMALADARDDRIIAVDANPDRGTLADRVGRPNGRTVRDLVRARDEVTGYADVSSIVARDATRLDVLASDADPRVSEAFSDEDYRDVATVAAHYYSIVLTDTGTGIVHSVMGATLEQSDSLVIVAGLSVDEARLASETLTWLETNGYAGRVRDAVVVLNNARPGTPLVRESELETHFRTRVRAVVRMPYDPLIATGSAISFRDLQPGTRQAARELAAAVVEGLRSPAAAA